MQAADAYLTKVSQKNPALKQTCMTPANARQQLLISIVIIEEV